tara:strand:- start:727 stop:2154 length:1428 start_codon:yes stop_codon:yes gene_type:complete
MKYKAELTMLFNILQEGRKIKDIADVILDKHKEIKLKKGTLVVYLRTLKREASVVAEIENDEDWSVIKDNYMFKVKGDHKVFSVKLIDDIFLFYTSRGYNFTRSQVQQRFNLTPKAFSTIQNKFNLSKASDIFSPHTKNTVSREELSELTDKVMEEIVNSGELTTRKHHQALKRKYTTVINRENLDVTWHNEVISEIIAEYPNCEKIKVKESNGPVGIYKEMSVNVADLHSGSKSDRMKITKGWSMAIMEDKLSKVATIVNSYNCPKVHLNFLGDLVETVSGINHPDSWKLIEDGMFGAATILEAKNVLVRFINKINNVVSINGVGGNHDRLQASNKLGDTGATDLIFAMIKERMELSGVNIPVNYDPVLLSLDREEYGDILCHGDKGLHKRSLEFLVLEFAKNKSKFQFVGTAHFHTFVVKNNDSQYFARRIVNPSIITGNNYSDVEIGKSDRSGFSINTVNIFGEPDQLIHNV